MKTTYDPATRVATVIAPDGTGSRYSAKELSPAMQEIVFGRGFTGLLTTLGASPADAHKQLVNGEYGKSAGPKDMDPWRKAAAFAWADIQARERGLKAMPGKKLVDHPDYKALVEEGEKIVAAWPKEKVAAAKKTPEIVAHHAKLTDAPISVASLFE